MSKTIMTGSFRDPSGHIYIENDVVYRQINLVYKEDYDYFIQSGLYKELVHKGLLIPHQEVKDISEGGGQYYKIIQPEEISFISYPYEWSFNQLKDAALITLQIQKIALKYGMSLKDASAYNVQFQEGKPIFIDTLSFQRYRSGEPWIAYHQYCQHFLAPLALMSFTDVRLSQLFRIYIDGIPLDLAASLLPLSVKIKPSIFMHIVLHAKSQSFFGKGNHSTKKHVLLLPSFFQIIDDLDASIQKLILRQTQSQWSEYYDDCQYTEENFNHKKRIVSEFLDQAQSKKLWDLGANQGVFSMLASQKGIQTIAFDCDPIVIDALYQKCCQTQQKFVQPLVLDLVNPSPAIGWENKERLSFIERVNADTVLALALIHHLAISNNLPFFYIANFLSKLCDHLIIEFIPKSDPQVQRKLLTRRDIFLNYDQENFEKEFQEFFIIQKSEVIKDSARILYLMKRKLRNA